MAISTNRLPRSLFPTHTSSSSLARRRPKGFAELLGRSNFSFLQGASKPEEMVQEAIRQDYEGIAICDLHGLYGVARGYQATTAPSIFEASLQAKKSFRYSFGTEFILTDQSHIALLPMNKDGYKNLCDLITVGKRQATKGFCQLSLEQVLARHEGLVAFALPPIETKHFEKIQNVFQDRLFLPVWRDLTWESREFYKKALELEAHQGAQLFVTNRPFMHEPERKPVFDVLTCIHHHTTLEEAKDKLLQNGERHLRPLDGLYDLWQDRPDLIEKTLEISSLLEFRLDEIRYRYPNSNLPEKMSPTEYIRHLSEKGLRERYNSPNIPADVQKTLDHELKIIRDLEYEDYFLTLYEICQFALSRGILYQGRGSAANSVVCYALKLTAVNPVQMGFLFERFISMERKEPPDIDIDFEHSRREEVIQHIYEKYGEHHAAMVCTVIRFRSRMAIRETAKVFGVPLAKVNRMIKFMGRDGMRRLIETPDVWNQFQLDEKSWQIMIHMASQLQGFPRHLGIHTGGFLITQDPITEMVPVEKATMTGRYVIQWNKDDVNFLKLMKIDMLSLGMLTALRKCFDLLKQHKNWTGSLAELPQEDAPTYEMTRKAETVGVFQIESRAQMQTLPRLKPTTFYDLVVQVAIVRPGPLQGGMVHPYLRRRQGLEKVVYAHKDLEPILKGTMGVPIFQEQVMKIVVAIAGFSPGEADELRRIMSNAWRSKGSMDGIKDRIFRGMKAHGVTTEYAAQIYKTIEGFANYGFPESHAASFALLSYASCFLKRHHPDVFVCALLNSQPMGFYPPRILISEAQRNGVEFLPLDVQKSDMDYALEGNLKLSKIDSLGKELIPIREGFTSIQGLPKAISKFIVQERQENGKFLSLTDFVQRTKAPRAALMKIAAAGAFRCFSNNARALLWQIESLSLDRQSFLWGHAKEGFDKNLEEESSEALPHESNWQLMQREYAHKGFSLEHHPMKILRSALNLKNEKLREARRMPFAHSENLKAIHHRSKVRVAGLLSITQRPPTAKGMCFLTLEDEFGFMNIVVPPDVYQKCRMVIYSNSLFEVQGQIEKSGALINIKAVVVLPLEVPTGAQVFEIMHTGIGYG